MKNPAPKIPPRWRRHQRALEEIRATLSLEYEEHTRAMREPLEHGGEDSVDVANEKSERSTLLAEIQLEENQLAEIDAALARIREGTFGICQATGQPIPEARLKAIPWTRFSCAAAKRATEVSDEK